MHKPVTIGITGGSGSGKSYFMQQLVARCGVGEVAVLTQDNYYHPIHMQPLDSSGKPNFDLPESIDINGFVNDLKLLIAGEELSKSEYTFNNPAVISGTVYVKPAPVILAEGIFLFSSPQILNLLDLKIFIEASEEIRLKRRLTRDQEVRGYPEEQIRYQYERHVAPCYLEYIEPFKKEADVVILNNGNPEKAIELLIHYVKYIAGNSQ